MSVPDANKFSNCNSYCPVRVKTRWLLPGWDRDSDWVGPQDEKGDGSGHLNISKTLTCPQGKDIICLFHEMYHKGLAMYNSCNKTRVHRKCVWNPQCNILNLNSPSGETGCLSAVCYFPGPVHEVILWPISLVLVLHHACRVPQMLQSTSCRGHS